MNSGLKLIVKLCGDQGLSETSSWARELQRAQARIKQNERASVPSAGSGSSGASQSPIDQLRGGGGVRADSAGAPATAATRGALSRGHTYSGDSLPQETPTLSRNVYRSETKKKSVEEFDDDLPLPPE